MTYSDVIDTLILVVMCVWFWDDVRNRKAETMTEADWIEKTAAAIEIEMTGCAEKDWSAVHKADVRKIAETIARHVPRMLERRCHNNPGHQSANRTGCLVCAPNSVERRAVDGFAGT